MGVYWHIATFTIDTFNNIGFREGDLESNLRVDELLDEVGADFVSHQDEVSERCHYHRCLRFLHNISVSHQS